LIPATGYYPTMSSKISVETKLTNKPRVHLKPKPRVHLKAKPRVHLKAKPTIEPIEFDDQGDGIGNTRPICESFLTIRDYDYVVFNGTTYYKTCFIAELFAYIQTNKHKVMTITIIRTDQCEYRTLKLKSSIPNTQSDLITVLTGNKPIIGKGDCPIYAGIK